MPNDVTLTGRRVTLRPPQAEDAEEMFEVLTSDREVTRYLSWIPHPDADETRRVITELFNTADDPTWVIELRDTGQLIGTCGWRRPVPHAVSLGYCLGRKWWGQGLMSEAAGLLVEAARRDPLVYRVAAHCHVDNVASAGVMRRCGLEFEGRLARYAVFPNLGPEPQDCLLFGKAVR